MPFILRTGLAVLLTALLFAAVPAAGASLAAADQNGGYSGKVLDKVIAVWAPPPALKGEFEVRLKVSLDGRGKVLNCAPTKASGMEALDSSACGAVRQAAPFGTPPYGMPLDVHLAFWTGMPKGKAKAEPLSNEEAMRAEVIARDKAERLMGQQRASSVEERARERAEAIAKSAGQPLPEVAPAPVAPPRTKAAADAGTRKKAAKGPQAGLSPDSPATEAIKPAKEKPAAPKAAGTGAAPPAPSGTGLSEEEMRLDLSDASAGHAAASAAGTPQTGQAGPHSMAQDQYGPRYRKYFSTITWNLRNAMFIPAETAPGTYYATVRLQVDAAGAIKKSTLLQGSGDQRLDKFVLQGIRRAGSVEPPPAGLGNTLDLTFTLVRR
ncbi:MAG: TonB family protein [Desulfovibrio sp.]|uniref:TonB family protein n=1 Tax=Desulfovibrio sp. TaxID=885 RepID=UPI0025BBF770|nr:TonB family protein [Desulfovibrio sp.]MBS6829393.1 TonB family protein [Desulfovibrio sp.]